MGNQSSAGTSERDGNPPVLEEKLDTVRLRQAYKQLTADSPEEGSQGLSLAKFQELFHSCPHLADLLLKSQRCPASSPCVNEDLYVAIGNQVTAQSDLSAQSAWLFRLFSEGQETLKAADFQKLLEAVCRINWSYICEAECGDIEDSDPAFQAVTKSLFRGEETVDLSSVQRWCNLHAASLCRGAHMYAATALLETKCPSLQCSASTFSEFGQSVLDQHTEVSPPMAWLLSTTLPFSYIPADGSAGPTSSLPLVGMTSPGGWYRLYSSNEHGLSVNRFQHHVFEYKGATVSFIRFEGHLYCVAVDQEWRDTTSRWGGVNCCLLQLQPEFKVMQSGSPMVYLNLSNRSAPKCLQIGKTPQSTVLEINSDFDKVKHYGVEFSLQNMEVWGCSGSSAREAQMAQKKWEQREADKAKNRKLKIDKDEWNDSPDRQILEMGGVQTEHAER